MPYGNISAELPEGEIQFIKDRLQEITDHLPFIINLSPEEKSGLPNIGNKRHAFVQKAIEIAEANPQVIPSAFDLVEWQRDFNLYNALRLVLLPLKQLLEKILDTDVAVSSEAFEKALQFKGLLEDSNRTEPGLDALVQELQEFFERTPEDDEGETPTP